MMRINSLLLGIAAILPLIPLSGEDALNLRVVPSPNLLRNADFVRIGENGLPKEWAFDNCSKSPRFKSQVVRYPDGNAVEVASEWEKYGYWLQSIPLKKDESYYASCEVQSDGPNFMIWIQCMRGRTAEEKKDFYKQYRAAVHLRTGLPMREALQDFVDESLLTSLCSDQWSRIGCEVVLPKEAGDCLCEVRMGVYGGYAGKMRFRKPVFRKMASELKAEISGTGWTELRIRGAKPVSVKLDPALAAQSCSFILPKALYCYKVELIGSQGKTITREITNE